MAFMNRINSEYIFFREGEKLFLNSLEGLDKTSYYSDYGNELRETITIPATEASISDSILAIINWACCIEATFNKMFYRFYREEPKKYKNVTFLNIPKKIDHFNKIFNNSINDKLRQRIVTLAKTRNRFVHYDDIPIYSGGDTLSEEYKDLSLRKMLIYRAAVYGLAKVVVNHPKYGFDILDNDHPIYGEGDLLFPDTLPPIVFKESIKKVLGIINR